MIQIFFTEDGYYMTGEGVEIARRCSPATTDRGDRIFQPLHHTYKVLYLALCELRNIKTTEDVMVYGNNRIIEEINGYTEPLDPTCKQWLEILRRRVIPSIAPLIFFRKKPVDEMIRSAHGDMIEQVDKRTLRHIAEQEARREYNVKKERKHKTIKRFKESWFQDGN